MKENSNFINNIKTILDKSNNKEIDKLYNDMSTYQKNIFNSWNNDINSFIDYSFSDLLFDFDKNFVEKILEIELDIHLNKLKEVGIYNKRNGHTKDITLTLENRQIIIMDF